MCNLPASERQIGGPGMVVEVCFAPNITSKQTNNFMTLLTIFTSPKISVLDTETICCMSINKVDESVFGAPKYNKGRYEALM